jgi:hypothetical protein
MTKTIPATTRGSQMALESSLINDHGTLGPDNRT